MSSYPQIRMRRLRRHDWTRRLVAENTLSPADFIWPVFVKEGGAQKEPVPCMPGVHRLTVPALVKAAEHAAKLGIPMLSLFPYVPKEKKTEDAREAWQARRVGPALFVAVEQYREAQVVAHLVQRHHPAVVDRQPG